MRINQQFTGLSSLQIRKMWYEERVTLAGALELLLQLNCDLATGKVHLRYTEVKAVFTIGTKSIELIRSHSEADSKRFTQQVIELARKEL